MKRQISQSTGGITLMVLVLLVVFTVMMSAVLRYISRQSHDISVRQAALHAQSVAETGVARALWYLQPGGGNKAATEVALNQASNKVSTTVLNTIFPATQSVNFLEFTEYYTGDKALAVRSLGARIGRPDTCQAVEANIHEMINGGYAITKWLERPRDCSAGGLGCIDSATSRSGVDRPYCPQFKSGCFAYPLFAQPAHYGHIREVKSVLTADDAQTCAHALGSGPRDAYWIGVKSSDFIRVNATGNGFNPTISVWGPGGSPDCPPSGPTPFGITPSYSFNCQVRPNYSSDHLLVIISAPASGQKGEYVLTIQYDG